VVVKTSSCFIGSNLLWSAKIPMLPLLGLALAFLILGWFLHLRPRFSVLCIR
jgi:hypothetical protein